MIINNKADKDAFEQKEFFSEHTGRRHNFMVVYVGNKPNDYPFYAFVGKESASWPVAYYVPRSKFDD